MNFHMNGKFIATQYTNSEAPEWLLDQVARKCYPDYCTDILFTGSKFIHGPDYNKKNGESDWDIVVYGDLILKKIISDKSWVVCGECGEYYGENSKFHAFRKGDLNLIIVKDQIAFERWKIASYAAKHLCVFDKSRRVDLFNLVHSLP